MTNLNPPPPQYAPPSPDKNRRSCMIAAAIIVGGLLIVIAAVAFGVYKVSELAKSDPKPFPGYGKPKLVKKLSEGWGLYSIPDLGYQIELPSKPKPEKPEWSSEHRILVKAWSNYTLEGNSFGFDMDGYEFRLPYTKEEMAEDQKETYAGEPALKNLRSATEPATVGGKDAILQVFNYEQDGEPSITKIYHLNDGDRSLALYFHYWKPLAAEVTKDIQRVVKSVKFDR